jgi:dTDP-4-amino-4,6-dideoxygalactose transaminase
MIVHSRPYIRDEEISAVQKIMKSGNINIGKYQNQFLNKLKDYLKVGNVGVTESGASAISSSFEILNIQANNEVLLPAYLCDSVLTEIKKKGAKAVFYDLNSNWTANIESIKNLISDSTKVIVLVHTFGIESNINAVMKLGVPVIEDACQSFGLEINGKKAGTIGDFGVFSFHPTKCLTSIGGGAISINNGNYSKNDKAIELIDKFPLLFSDLNAIVGLEQLNSYNEFLERRRKIAQTYNSTIDRLRKGGARINKLEKENSIFYRYVIQVEQREKLISFLEANSIMARRGVDELLTQSIESHLKQTEMLYDKTVSLPCYPVLTDDELFQVCNGIEKFYTNEIQA